MTPRYHVHVPDDAHEHYKDLRGLPIESLEALKDSELSVLRTGKVKDGDPELRLLTYEQVRMMRDLWIVGAIMDGFTETVELALAILSDDGRHELVGLGPRELFLCEPRGESDVTDGTLRRMMQEDEPDDETLAAARALGASLLRLVREGYITMPLGEPLPYR